MVWIVAHAVLGLAVVAWVVRVHPLVRTRPPEGPALTALEAKYLVVGLASWVLGYVFNIQFVREYAVPGGNPLTSCAFGFCLYFFAAERLRRHGAWGEKRGFRRAAAGTARGAVDAAGWA